MMMMVSRKKISKANILNAILTNLLTRSDPARSTINSLLTKKKNEKCKTGYIVSYSLQIL